MSAGTIARAADGRPVEYERRHPEQTILYQTLQQHLETFIADVEADGERRLPRFVKRSSETS